MHSPWRWYFLACVGLSCLALPACMQVPLCIPELNYVAPVELRTASAEVHAFRVDVTEKSVVNISEDYRGEGGAITYWSLRG